MVCKDCVGHLSNWLIDGDTDQYLGNDFRIWIGGMGRIVNCGDGGDVNWQYEWCMGTVNRSGVQNHTVDFPACPGTVAPKPIVSCCP